MHITSETLNAFLIGVLCSFAPSVLFLAAWLTGFVRAEETRAKHAMHSEQVQLTLASKRRHISEP